MPATSTVSPAGNAMVDGVLSGWKWGVSSLTYSFPTSAAYYGTGYGSGEPSRGFEALNAAQQNAVRAALGQYSAVANVAFTEIAETSARPADLRFAESDLPGTAWAYMPSTRVEGGDSWFNNSRNYYDAPVKGNYAYTSFLHEIGHALGLKHPHEASGAFPAMPSSYNSMNFTVMSYRSYTGASSTAGYTNETWGYAQSLMMADIAAVQRMYGANFNTNSGNTTYTWSPTSGEMFVNGAGQGAPGGNKIFLTIWDGGGTDTYDFSNYTTNLNVSLAPGGWSTVSSAQLARLHYDGSKVAAGNIGNALQYNGDARSLIENAKGGKGSDSLGGNAAINTLTGNAGNDKLSGLTANDKLYGGDGSDQLTGGAGNDTLDGGRGTDTAIFSGKASAYSWKKNSNGTWTVTDKSSGSPDGADTLVGVEVLKFSDKSVTIGTASAAARKKAAAPANDESASEDSLPLPVGSDAFHFRAEIFQRRHEAASAEGGAGELWHGFHQAPAGDGGNWRFGGDDAENAAPAMAQGFDAHPHHGDWFV